MSRPYALLLLTILFTLTTVTAAVAVPTRLAQQGRLLDGEGAPLTGTHALIFSIYDAATDGNEVWREERSVDFDEGYYAVVLGTLVPVDDLLFAAGAVWLELTADGAVLSPRQELVSVPWALRATSAEHVDGGGVDATEVSVGGVPVIDSTGTWVGPTPSVDWSELSGVPAGLSDGDSDTLLGLPCADGFVAKYSATLGAWDCAQDNDSLAALVCLPGDIPVLGPGPAGWSCGTDQDTVTSTLPWSSITAVPADLADGDQDTVTSTLPWSSITAVPADLADGDQDTDTQLNNADVDAFVENGPLTLAQGTTIAGQAIATGVPTPAGVILMWSGSLASIPLGWALCDGSNGTPNLLDRFIASVPTASAEPGGTGGSNTQDLSHVHSYSGSTSFVFNNRCSQSCSGNNARTSHDHSYSGTTDSGGQVTDLRPSYYQLAFIQKL